MTGEAITADDSYIRESILEPAAKLVAGYGPLMPTYKGQVDEEGLLRLVSYIKTLKVETEDSTSEESP